MADVTRRSGPPTIPRAFDPALYRGERRFTPGLNLMPLLGRRIEVTEVVARQAGNPNRAGP